MKLHTLRSSLACATLALLGACSLALPSSELSNGIVEADADGGNLTDAAEPREDSAVVLDAAADGSLDAAPEGRDTRDAAKPDAASPQNDTDASSVEDAGNEVEPEPVAGREYTSGNITGFGAKCLEASSTSDATQLWQCDPTRMQQRWEIRIDDDKTLRLNGKCLAVEFGASADGTPVTLSPCDHGIAQRWTYGQGLIKHDASGKCLDVKDVKSADGTPMQLWTCSSKPQQNWRLPSLVEPSKSMFGPNVYVFDASSSREEIQRQLNLIFREQETNQFGEERFLILFKPGIYAIDVNVGFYTHVAGLGTSPDDVQIQGAVHAEADWWGQRNGPANNATQNFWRTAENLSVTPPSNADRWAVSQASAYRRMHLRGDLRLDDGGWASGGFIADSWIEGTLLPGKQQQWLTRNSEFQSWQQPSDSGWNMVFVGDIGAPATSFPKPPLTTIDLTPVVREKPFLSIDAQDNYHVFVPPLRSDERGTSWAHATPNLSPLPLDQFAIVRPSERAADEMNQALDAGKHLLVMPGVYHLTKPIEIKRPNTVVLGLGLPTFVADNGAMAISIEDVDGVKLAGLIIDAGETSSPLLMQVGAPGSKLRHAANPTSLHDLYFRIGGARIGKAAVSL
ncbi:MAG TPA: RICIN domain-containing protein, partial [Gemmatimonadaceae bacterium]|nr:RICIN domain-containing protein [Gemmatimonadaceae bacterium]